MFFRQRFLRIGIIVTILVSVLACLALFGTISTATPKHIPIALVNLDQGAMAPGGQRFAIGDTIKGKLTSLELPVDWKIVKSKQEALHGMDEQDYYGAIILPEDLSSGFTSLASPTPHPATVELYENEGMNPEIGGKVSQMLETLMAGVNQQLSGQMLEQISANTAAIPVNTVKALMNPISLQEQAVHPVGASSAGGNAPSMITLMAWLVSLVSSVFLYRSAVDAVSEGMNRGKAVLLQGLTGIFLAAVYSGLLVWMCSEWYGLPLPHWGQTWMFLWLCFAACFVLQSSLLNIGGLPAIAVLVLLLFFSIPVINLPPQLLPDATRDWLYSWIPLRFIASGLRDLLYFPAIDSQTIDVVWGILIGFAALMVLSLLRFPAKSRSLETERL